ncbi:MAG: RnfABCDGE type electron transport complex subunit G [Alistipes sp.]|nr:RnfABCDGE type electron transport complex subunit G [Alistipes sp.]
MESTLKNMILTLLVITLISAGALSMVYSMTKDAIEQSKSAKTLEALEGVLPPFDNNPATDTVTVEVNNLPIKVYTGRSGGVPSGYAVETITRKGYSGDIRMMVGFEAGGDIYNIEVLEHSETPGLGSKIADDNNPVLVSFKGRNPADLVMKVTKDGGDIDAITASTISSRAYTDAVERAYAAYRTVALGEEQAGPDIADYLPVTGTIPDNSPAGEAVMVEAGAKSYRVYHGTHAGELLWVAVESVSEGYNAPIRMLVSFSPDGTVLDISVIEQMESEDYGAVIGDGDNPLRASFIGRDPGSMKLLFRYEGGDVDGISGSSITSQAYVDAVSGAYKVFQEYMSNR